MSSSLASSLASMLSAPSALSSSPSPGSGPIVGVLCIDIAQRLQDVYGPQVRSYVAASYVKWLEGAGARPVPVWIGRDRAYYEDIMGKINGILIPGGAVLFDSAHITKPEHTNDVVRSSQTIYEIAAKLHEHFGETFPIWGTCLGMELLLFHSAEGNDPRQNCYTMRYGTALDFVKDFRQSRLFSTLGEDLEHVMRTLPFAYHFHRYCITKKDLWLFKINDNWRVLATNKDSKGLEFISVMEHKRYPFYGVQFHPEKVLYEQFGECSNFCHAPEAIRAAQYFVDFFVNECRKSSHRFASEEEELRHSIYNFEVTMTGRERMPWIQCYLFGDGPEYPSLRGEEEKLKEKNYHG